MAVLVAAGARIPRIIVGLAGLIGVFSVHASVDEAVLAAGSAG
jgi:hypothetical protein